MAPVSPMTLGVVLPQGWLGEYRGWDHRAAWQRTLALARTAESLGFESVWVYDHFTGFSAPAPVLTFEAFSTLAAVAAVTERVRLGPLVAGAGYRNPALLAKMTGTLDVIAGGRFEIGVGAGWKRDEYEAYGYPFPPLRERMELLRDTLEVLTLMLGPDEGRGSYAGTRASVADPVNRAARRRAAACADHGRRQRPRGDLAPRGALRGRAESRRDGSRGDAARDPRDPVALRGDRPGPGHAAVSAHLPWRTAPAGPRRAEWLHSFADAGVARAMAFVPGAVDDDGELARLADDARAAGLSMPA